MALTDKLSAIGDAIRAQSGKTAKIPLAQMPTEILSLQSLNFEVVGNPKPQNPKENTIWLNTDVAIPSWTFDAVEPGSGADGSAFIKIGKEGNYAFNALKENRLVVYPLYAEQYVSDAWGIVEAQIFKNNKWNALSAEVVLFDGVLNTATFGDYVAQDGVKNFTISNGDIRFYYYNSSRFTELFDVTAFDRIEMYFKNYNNVGVDIYLVDESGNKNKLVRSGTEASGSTVTYDVSAYTGKYYVQLVTGQKPNDLTTYSTVSSIKFKA